MPRTLALVEPHDGPIRWGIAATGKIAGSFARAFPHIIDPDASLVAVGSRRHDTASAFAAAHAIPVAHGSYADLAADPDVDIVYVASLQPGHVADAVRFLDAGKHVLVEKPMALSAAGVDTILSAAEANDRFAMEAMWMRFSPGPVAGVAAVEAGDIGTLERLEIDFTIQVADDPDHRLRSLEKGGGALLVLGIYPGSLAWWLLGPPTSWTVDGDVAGGVDIRCVIDAAWPGVTARLSCGLDEVGPLSAIIRGDHGQVTFVAPFHATDTIVIDDTTTSFEAASLHHQVNEVNRCLRAGVTESARNPWATTRAILAWCDEILAELGVVYPAGC